MEALRVAQGASTYTIKSSNASGESRLRRLDRHGRDPRRRHRSRPTGPRGDFRIRFRRRRPAHPHPRMEIVEPGADLSTFAGNIVFIGVSAQLALRHRRHAAVARHARRAATRRDRRPDSRQRQADPARLGAWRRVPLHGGACRAARPRPALSLHDRRRAGRARRGDGLGGGQLDRLQPLRPAARSDHALARGGRGLCLRRAGAVRAQAGRGARDSRRLRPLCLADRRRQARRRPDGAAARRRGAAGDADVLGRARLHDASRRARARPSSPASSTNI